MATTYEFVVETLEFYPGCGDDPEIIDCCFSRPYTKRRISPKAAKSLGG